jgi:arylsulfatase A-like enzyme
MSADRPNVVLVTTDQQRLDTINALGASHMDTPNLDRLVNEGVTFTDCHVTAPLCVPSRASLFTGYYPHTTGIYSNESPWRHTWVERLRDDGYYTVNVGKMHTIPFDAPAGFDERYPVENKDRYLASVPKLPSERFYFDEWDRALAARGFVKQQREFYRHWEDYEQRLGAHEWELPEDTHPNMFVGDMTTWWLDTMPRLDRPLFLEVGFPGPHPPSTRSSGTPRPTLTGTSRCPTSRRTTSRVSRRHSGRSGSSTQRWTWTRSATPSTPTRRTSAGCERTTTPTWR